MSDDMSTPKKSLLPALLPKNNRWTEQLWLCIGILLFRINGFPEKDWRTPPITTEKAIKDSIV
jgi:hypothetical protein